MAGKAAVRWLRALLVSGMLAAGLACAVPQGAQAAVGDEFQAAAGTSGAQAVQSGTAVTYKVLEEADGASPGTVQVGGAAAGSAVDLAYTGAVALPAIVEHDGKRYAVTVIGARAFQNAALGTVSVPDSVLHIYEYAFYGCYSLQHVAFGVSPALQSIERYAFCLPKYREEHQDGLRELTIPASVRYIRDSAFLCQPSLKELHFAATSMEKINDYAFSNCRSLEYAEIPGVTAETNALGCRLFYNCSSLKTVVFLGDVASASRTVERSTRNFEGCTQLETVVYHGKKFLPTWSTPTNTAVNTTFYSSDPNLYYTLTYYPSRQAAESGTGALGFVRVRADASLADVQAGLPASDAAGPVVYEGSVPAYPAGATGWAYEGSPAFDAPLEDSLYAYPVDAADFAHASVSAAAAVYDCTGRPVDFGVRVIDASGAVLARGADYELSYAREDGRGAYAASEDIASPGKLRIIATPLSPHRGQAAYTDVEIAYAQAGSTFTSEEGVTYMVAEPASAGSAGTAVVGDGTSRAVDCAFSGSLSIPQAVSPAGSDLSYKVVGVSAYAFGAEAAQDACTALEGVELPEGLESIGDYAFAQCSSLRETRVPASVTTLGTRAFQNCASLASLEFAGASIDRIGAYCFAQCSALTALELPSLSGAGTLANHAFANCVRLQRVVFAGAVHPSDNTQFSGCSRLTRAVFCEELWADGFGPDTTLYALVSFYASQAGMKAGAEPLGHAAVRLGTAASKLAPSLGAPSVLDGYGSVPVLPSGTSVWTLASKSTAVGKPEAAYASKPAGGTVGKTYKAGSGAGAGSYTVVSAKAVALKKAANRKAVTVPASVTVNGVSYKVRAVKAKAFSASPKCRTVTVKSMSITSFSNAFKGSKVAKVKVPKAKKAAYKKLLTKKKCGKKVAVA